MPSYPTLTRRAVLASSAVLLSTNLIGAPNPLTHSKYLLYVGAYGTGIDAYRFDPSDGKLTPIGQSGKINNPSFIIASPDHSFLYAVSEVEGNHHGAVAAFAIDKSTGALRMLNQQDSGGVAPCHLAVDKTRKLLLVANYTSGGVSAYPIQEDGSLGTMSALMTAEGHGPNAKRQEGPHAHEVVISSDNKLAYVPDLGLDELRIYSLDPAEAKVTAANPPHWKQDAGMGPRHFVFNSDESFAYLVNELKSDVSVLKHEAGTGKFTKIQDASTLPAGYTGDNGPAEVLIDQANRFVYATNRGADNIVVFSVNPDHTLAQIQVISAEGKMPRGLAFDPSGKFLFCGNQKTNNFVVYRVDAQSGKLAATGQVVNTPSPVAFVFVPAE